LSIFQLPAVTLLEETETLSPFIDSSIDNVEFLDVLLTV